MNSTPPKNDLNCEHRAARRGGPRAAGKNNLNKIQNYEPTMSPEFSAFFLVARLRFRAEECRVISEDMTTPDNRALMQRLAADYDQLADNLENMHVVH